MKKLTSILVVALLAPLAAFAANFEGKVTMQMTGPRAEAIPMTFSLKTGFTRIDMSAQGHDVGVIIDQSKSEMTILMPQQRMYMVRPVPTAQSAMPEAASGSDVSLEKTGDHEKILGYDTTKYVVKSKDGTTELWVTDQLGVFNGLGAGGNPMAGGFGRRPANSPGHQAWEDAFRGKPMFPLRVTTTNPAGKQTFKMEATAVEKQSLPDSVFTPPADYQKLDLGNMMQGMGMPGMSGGMHAPGGGD